MNVTPTQLATLRRMALDRTGTIVPFSRIWWAPPSTELHAGAGLIAVPTWWVDHRTIAALERRGLIERNCPRDRLGEARILTAAGRRFLEESPGTTPVTGTQGAADVTR